MIVDITKSDCEAAIQQENLNLQHIERTIQAEKNAPPSNINYSKIQQQFGSLLYGSVTQGSSLILKRRLQEKQQIIENLSKLELKK